MANKFFAAIRARFFNTAADTALDVGVSGDANPRLSIDAGGKISWGDGTNAVDTNIYRDSASVLKTDDTLKVPALFIDGIEVDTSGATTDQVLKYNGTKFLPATGSSVGALDDLTDVVITTPVTTQFVRYNGTNFVNATISAGDVPTLNQNTTGTAATVTGAAQTAITSVGTLTSLAVTGALTVDTTTLKVDSTNNCVGIGTASPSTALDVVGTTTLKTVKAGSGVVAISNAIYVSAFATTQYTTTTPHGFATGDTVAVTGITPSSWNRTATITINNSTQFFFSVFNGSTGGTYSSGGTVTGPPSTLYVDTTNDRIGIGTSSPATKLDVLGTATATAFAGPLTGNASTATLAATVTTNANLTGGVTSVGNAATVITNANLTGDVTSVGNATTLTNAPVIAKVLTGYVSGSGTVAATDSILQAFQKLNGNDALKADLASPTFTGTPTLPTGTIATTQTAADSSTKLATTAFVTTADNLKANIASPTLTGTPLSTTAAVDTNTTQIATTAYVVGQGYAKLASPTFTGTVTVPTPTNSTDAVTKAYADAIKQGLDIKDSVRVASTVNIAVASALTNASTIDGVVVATGDRVLLKNQTAGAENGIYVVVASGTASRSTDADTSAKVTSGMYVFVSEGTVSADMGYVLTTNDAITLDTTSLSFTQFSGAGQITAGTGLSKSGNTLSIDTTVTANLTTAQTLTNKTLTTPVINGTITGTGQATTNTASTIVMRDASGNFAAGTITAALTGTASGNLVSVGALGTPSSGTLTNCTFPTLNQNTTGTAATVTGAAQTAITSVGTLSGLRVDGNTAIGTVPLAGYSFFVSKPITGLTTSYGIVSAGTVQSDVTSGVNQFISGGNTAAVAFTLGSYNHFTANGIATPGAGSTITTQTGFTVNSTTTGATNNYAFRGLIPTGANNNWNLHMDGTAPNYMLGRLAIGSSSLGTTMLRVTNDTAANSTLLLRNAAAQSGLAIRVVDDPGADIFTVDSTGRLGVGATLTSGAMAQIKNTTAGDKAFVVKGAASQSGDFFDIQNSGGTSQFKVDSVGNVSIGGSPAVGRAFTAEKTMTGSIQPIGIFSAGQIQSDATSGAHYFNTYVNTAASVTTSTLVHYTAQQGPFGAGSTVSGQIGFNATPGLIGATSNYGFFGSLPADAAKNYNLHMGGTAPNYLLGRLGVGAGLTSGAMAQVVNTTAADKAFVVKGHATQSGDLFDVQTSSGFSLFKINSSGAGWFRQEADGIQTNLQLGRMDAPNSGTPLYQIQTDDTNGDILRFYSTRYSSTVKFARNSSGGDKDMVWITGGDGGHAIEIFNTSNSVNTRINSNGATYFNGGNVGIGTASPTANLNVYSASNANVLFDSGASINLTFNRAGTGNYNSIRLNTAGTTRWAYGLQNDATDNFFIGSGAVAYDSATAPKFVIQPGGNVGIGTATPSTALQVVGTVTATAFAGPLTGNVTGNVSGTAATVTGAAQTAITSVGTLSALRVDGNFGIGGAGFAQIGLRFVKAIGGSAFSQGIFLGGEIQATVTTRADMIWTAPTVAASVTLPTLQQFYATVAGIGTGSTITASTGFYAESNIGNNDLGTITNAYGFFGNIASGTGRYNLYMQGTAGNYMAGRLGVGAVLTSGIMAIVQNTTAADKAFVVKGAASQSGNLFEIQNSASTALVTVNSAGEFVGMIQANKNFGNSYAASFAARADSSAQGLLAGYSFYPTFVGTGDNAVRRAADISAGFTGAWATEYLSFGVGIGASNDTGLKTTERMRIDGAGNVGIGTNSPSSYGLLSVSASISASTTKNMIAMQQSAGVDSATMRIAGYAYTGNARTAIDFVQNAGTNFNSQMVFSTSAGADAVERMRIASNGDVGIGTSSPTVKLQVTGSTHLTGAGTFPATGTGIEFTPSVAGGTNYIQAFSRDAGTWQTLAINSGLTTFSTAGTERMRIDSAGLVGIGGAAPAYAKINVGGTLPSSSNLTQVFRSSGTIPSTTTNIAWGYLSALSTQEASFTLGTLLHFAVDPGAFGAGSTVTAQRGFSVGSTLTGASYNYGFFGDIASGTNRWNLYMGGTAQNYMAGDVGIGGTDATSKLFVQASNLGGTAGNEVIAFKTYSNNGNGDYVSTKYRRVSTGATWITAQAKIQRTIDGTDMGYVAFGGTSAFDVRIGSGTTDIATFVNNGNVGIGTSSPSTTLDVVGNSTVSGVINGGQLSADLIIQTQVFS